MTATRSEPVLAGAGQVEDKPLMSGRALLMMNLGFFGVQFSFGLTQSAVNPLFLLIGASPSNCRSSTWLRLSPVWSFSR